ncbi:MAG: hypothetical protein JSV89_06980 [Spirochaetaceae bacterium]|nr:MAG: hypothetical protein JSV89_06980 [Spirochaetaceae bacterium]
MKIYPGQNTAGQVSRDRLNDRSVVRGGEQTTRSAEPAHAADNPVPEIRKQIMVVQRSLGRYQSILGGFEGFRPLLEAGAAADEASRYISRIVYRGEAVLEPFSVELHRILQAEDRSALQRLIDNARNEIHGFAVQLSRLETAEQNSRSLGASSADLSDILVGIRSEGDQLLKLEGKNVLELLG